MTGSESPVRVALRRWLAEDYCARCDSSGHVQKRESGTLWCGVCWDIPKPLPSSLRKAIAALDGEPSPLAEALERLADEAESYVGIGHALADEDRPLREAVAAARAALGA